MSNAKQFVVLGYSGAGKDTVAKLLDMYRPNRTFNLKWSSKMKQTFAEWYGVDYEQFNDPIRRHEKVAGEEFTYLDVMMRAYHAWDSIDPKLTVRPLARDAKALLDSGVDVIYTDTRKIAEAGKVAALSYTYSTHIIHVYGREGEVRRSTDWQLEAIRTHIETFGDNVKTHKVLNNGSEDELLDRLDNLGLL